MDILTEILVDSVLLLGVVVGVFCFALGVMMLVAPDVVLRVSSQLGEHWFSARRALKPAEIPRRSESLFYRHHRVGGLVLVAAAVVIGWSLWSLDPGRAVEVFSKWSPRVVVAWILDAGIILMWLVTVIALITGSVVFFRPSTLKGVEAWSNRWVSTRRATRFLEQSHDPLARLFARWPRVFGLFITVGSLYLLVVVSTFIMQQP